MPVGPPGNLHALLPQHLADRPDRAAIGARRSSMNARINDVEAEFPGGEARRVPQTRVRLAQLPIPPSAVGTLRLARGHFLPSPALTCAYCTHRCRNGSAPNPSRFETDSHAASGFGYPSR